MNAPRALSCLGNAHAERPAGHAARRALERYGAALEPLDERILLMKAICGDAKVLRRPSGAGKRRVWVFLVRWDRIDADIAIVVGQDMAKIITVLAPDCAEVRRAAGALAEPLKKALGL